MVDTQTGIEAAEAGIDLMNSNKFTEAEEMLKPWYVYLLLFPLPVQWNLFYKGHAGTAKIVLYSEVSFENTRECSIGLKQVSFTECIYTPS